MRLALVALPLLLLLGLNGRTVSVLRAPGPGETQASAASRATLVRQRVLLEAAAPLRAYLAPSLALGWGPGLPAAGLAGADWVRRARAGRCLAATGSAPLTFVAAYCRERLLGAAQSPQAP